MPMNLRFNFIVFLCLLSLAFIAESTKKNGTLLEMPDISLTLFKDNEQDLKGYVVLRYALEFSEAKTTKKLKSAVPLVHDKLQTVLKRYFSIFWQNTKEPINQAHIKHLIKRAVQPYLTEKESVSVFIHAIKTAPASQ